MKKALITGASGVVGTRIYTFLRDKGFEILTIGRKLPSCAEKADFHLYCDFSRREDTANLGEKLLAHDDIELVVLGAGIDSWLGYRNFAADVFDHVLRVNCTSQIEVIQALLSAEPTKKLRLVVISSTVLTELVPDSLVYAVSKAALEVAAHNMCTEDRISIHVTCVRLPFVGVKMSNIAERMGSGFPDDDSQAQVDEVVIEKLFAHLEQVICSDFQENTFNVINI